MTPSRDNIEDQKYTIGYSPSFQKTTGTGQIILSPFLKRLRDCTNDPLEGYEVFLQSDSLSAKSLHEYTSRALRVLMAVYCGSHLSI
jgi:hypothetical protein